MLLVTANKYIVACSRATHLDCADLQRVEHVAIHVLCVNAFDDETAAFYLATRIRPVLGTLVPVVLDQLGCHDNRVAALLPHHAPEVRDGAVNGALTRDVRLAPPVVALQRVM